MRIKRLARNLREAKLRLSDACIEGIDYPARRKPDKAVIRGLASCAWVQEQHNVVITGPTGVGKTEIARRLARLAGAPFVKVEAGVADGLCVGEDGSVWVALAGGGQGEAGIAAAFDRQLPQPTHGLVRVAGIRVVELLRVQPGALEQLAAVETVGFVRLPDHQGAGCQQG